MRIFLFEGMKAYTRYARFSHLGTWTPGILCKSCGQSTQKLTEPLLAEWEPDSDFIADFSWCSYVALITQEVAEKLLDAGFEIALGSVDFVKPSQKRARKPRVAYPYSGPPLFWMMPTERVSVDEEGSNIRLDIDCKECGQKRYTFRREGLAIDSKNWNSPKIFRVAQYTRSRAMFVSEQGRDIILRHGFTNVRFSEAGIIS